MKKLKRDRTGRKREELESFTIGSEQMGRRRTAAAEAKMAKGIRQVKTISDGNKDKAVSACQG